MSETLSAERRRAMLRTAMGPTIAVALADPAPLVAAAIAARGRASQLVDATELIVTTDQFGGAEPLPDDLGGDFPGAEPRDTRRFAVVACDLVDLGIHDGARDFDDEVFLSVGNVDELGLHSDRVLRGADRC